MKALVITNQVKNYTNGFKIMIDSLQDKGFEVFWAANFDNYEGDLLEIPCETRQISIKSNPLNLKNILAFIKLKNMIKKNHFNIIHCTTPIGAFLGRIAAIRSDTNKVIYTAHGFHFHDKGLPLSNFIFMQYEKLFARYTDILITINQQDYNAAKIFKLKKGGKLYVSHGAGVELNYNPKRNIRDVRSEFNIPSDAKIILSAGALNKNKNILTIIKALKHMQNLNFFYIICGEGNYMNKLKKKVKKYGLEKKVIFAGFRNDIKEIMNASDIFVMPSYREGLPRSVMEAMDIGLPCVVSNIRGNSDLIVDGKGGYLCNPNDENCFSKKIMLLMNNKDLANKFGNYNEEKVKKYSFERVKKEQENIYSQVKKIINI